MNPDFKKKLPMIILFCILLGFVVYLLTNSSGFGSVQNYPGKGYVQANTWNVDSWLKGDGDYSRFIFPDLSVSYPNGSLQGYGSNAINPVSGYTDATIFVTSFGAQTSPTTTSYALEDYTNPLQSQFTITINTQKLDGEFGLFNYILQTDQRIKAYMDNDTKLLPLTLTTGGSSLISVGTARTNVLGTTNPANSYKIPYYTREGVVKTDYMDIGKLSGKSSFDAISFNQALLIPADFNIKKPFGTFGYNGAKIGSGNFTSQAKLRLQIILGVLTAMHLLLNGSPATIASGGSGSMPIGAIQDYPSGTPAAPTTGSGPAGWSIAYDLANIYNPNSNPDASYVPYYWTRNLTGGAVLPTPTYRWSPEVLPTPYVLHALYLILNARNSWLNSWIASPTVMRNL